MPKNEDSGPITAGELVELRENDPAYQARQAARAEWAKARARRFEREERPLLDDLEEAGLLVDSVWDLVNTRERYPEAIPVLFKHLKNTSYSSEIREGIARALTVREAKMGVPELLKAFRRDPETKLNGPKWALGSAIEVLFNEDYVDEIIELVKDTGHGPARSMLVRALGKSKSQRARDAIESLRNDPDQDVAVFVEPALEKWEKRQARMKPKTSSKG